MTLEKEILDMLGQMNEKLKTIEVGLYGDEKNRQIGVIRRVEVLEKRMDDYEDAFIKEREINKTKNLKQDISLGARQELIDNTFKWMMRIIGGLTIAIGVLYFLTGKIGLLDLIK